jgi:exonuclease SbcC
VRLLKLDILNLNSLEGGWSVDFRDPAYRSSPLFVITGKMGAGKSTLLDAVCLALYRETPRLGKMTASSNGIMTRGTGECRAELTFEAKGRAWRASFYQHRADGKPGGKLQKYKHTLVDAETGKAPPDSSADAAREAENVTGLDFKRFTRCIVLPQNKFSEFMNKGPDDRSVILEKITDTGKYARISEKAFARAKGEAKRLDALAARRDELGVLPPGDEAALKESLAGAAARAARLAAERKAGEERARLARERAAAENRLSELKAAEALVAGRELAFAPDRERIRLDAAAAELDGPWELCENAREAALREEKTLAGLRLALPAAREAHAAAAAAAAASGSLVSEEEGALAEKLPVIAEAKRLDGLVSVEEARLKALKAEAGLKAKALDGLRVELASGEAALAEAKGELSGLKGALERGAALEPLAGELAGIKEEAAVLEGLRKAAAAKALEAEKAGAALAASKAGLREAEGLLAGKSGALALARAALENLERGRAEALKGKAPEEWQALSRNESARHVAFEKALDRFDGRAEALNSIAEKERLLSEYASKLAESAGLLEREKARREELGRSRELAKENLLLARAVKSLEEERKRLRDGKPCPLCGSTSHPVGHLARAGPGEAEGRLAELEAEIGVCDSLVGKLTQEADSLRAMTARAEAELPALRRKEREHAASLAALRGEEGLPDPETDGGRFRERLSELKEVSGAARDEADGALKKTLKLDRSLAAARRASDAAAGAEAEAKAAFQAVESREVRAVEALGRIGEELSAIQLQEAGRKASLEERARPYAAGPIGEGGPGALLEDLSLKLAGRNSLKESHAALSGQCQEDARALEEKRKAIGDRARELEEHAGPVAEAEGSAAGLRAERLELFGKLDPETEEKRLRDAAARAREEFEIRKQGENRLLTELKLGEKGIGDAEARAGEARRALWERERELAGGVASKGFADAGGAPDMAAFLAARLAPGERRRLLGLSEGLERDKASAKSLAEEAARASELASSLAREASCGAPEEEQSAALRLAEEHESAVGEKAALAERVRSNEGAKLKSEGLEREIEAQRETARRFERLSGLIGSADGKKFRNYAQALTLGALIRNANRQLKGMSGRYLLSEDKEAPLEFAVVDNFKGGAERPAKTLSGGETFIVSLALALGLADMTGRDFDLKSLFLDEGFGTLDEETLDVAVNALSELPGSAGKLVGLITHVAALKNRFAQIDVIAGRNGRSELVGPGCSRASAKAKGRG